MIPSNQLTYLVKSRTKYQHQEALVDQFHKFIAHQRVTNLMIWW